MSEATISKQERDTLLAKNADQLREIATAIRLHFLQAGAVLTDTAGLFGANETDAFYLWATNVTGWSKQRCKDYMDAYAVHESLTDAGRKKVASWPVDSLVRLKPIADPKDRGKVVRAIKGTIAQPSHVVEVRDRIVESGNSGTAGRNRKTDADVTVALAADLEAKVAKVLKDGRPEVALMIGANAVLDLIYAGNKKVPAKYDVPAAITHLVKNSEKVRAALTPKAGKAS